MKINTIKVTAADRRTEGSLHQDGSEDWQRVTDALPPMDTPCWLWDGKKIWIGGRVMVDSECWLWGNAYSSIWHNGVKWDADNDTDDDYQPTHWMSLPNPPNADIRRAQTDSQQSEP